MAERSLNHIPHGEDSPIIYSPKNIDLLARGVIGCDIEMELYAASYRGPIKIVGVTSQNGSTSIKPSLYFDLEWIAKEIEEGWILHEEPPDLNLGARLCTLDLEVTYIKANDDLTIDIVAPSIAFMIKIYPPGNNLKKEGIKSP